MEPGPQFHQLPMFMSSNEIRRGYEPHPGDFDETADEDGGYRQETHGELWERKADEANYSGLTDDLMQHGVQTPIPLNVTRRHIANGHHRVAAMGDINASHLLPIQHFEEHELKHGVYRGGGNAQSWDY